MDNTTRLDPVRCVQAIKNLKDRNEILQREKEKVSQELDNTKQLLADLTIRYNDILAKEASVSKDEETGQLSSAPSAGNKHIEDLSKENALLRKQLEDRLSEQEAEDIADRSMLMRTIDDYRKTIKDQNAKISLLRSENDQASLIEKQISRLSNILKKTQGINQSLSDEIISLQREMSHLQVKEQGIVKTYTASGDTEYNGPRSPPSASTSACVRKELEDLKTMENAQRDKISELVEEKVCLEKECYKKNEEIIRQKHEINRLLDENTLLKMKSDARSEQPVDHTPSTLYEDQMKVFMDDFHNERLEKQRIVQQKDEELHTLRHKYAELQRAISLNQAPQPHPGNTPPPRDTDTSNPRHFNKSISMQGFRAPGQGDPAYQRQTSEMRGPPQFTPGARRIGFQPTAVVSPPCTGMIRQPQFPPTYGQPPMDPYHHQQQQQHPRRALQSDSNNQAEDEERFKGNFNPETS
ncbi:uncharacterized protein LOC143470078 isoform X1 [Clavelina lepadiformis]|uniref:uncharacterized protein LOC143470078 isoform X1 n=1 Tax=Clavelina lepadiformis TaxID=159417 RepID=UPI0040419A3D